MKHQNTYLFRDILERVEVPVNVEPDKEYVQIGIRSHGKGLFYKEPVLGKALGNKQVFWIQPNCFILNVVFAWEQAITKTTENEIGMIGSHRFPMYRPKNDLVDINYLIYYFLTKRGTDILEAASPGGAGRNRTLGQERFLKSKITLPTLPEQQKIAAILSTQDKVIELKEKLLAQKQQQKKYLMQQLLTGRKPHKNNPRIEECEIGEVCKINPKQDKISESQVVFLGMADISETGSVVSQRLVDFSHIQSGFTAFRRGDILIAKITPCFENGKGAYTDNLLSEHGFGSTEFHVLRTNSKVNAKYIFYHTVSEKFRKKLEREMTGSAGQKRVPAISIQKYKIFLPSSNEQNFIIEILSTADHEIDLLQKSIDAEKQKKKALMQLLLTGKVRVKI
ncbi:restriction endonuclease subunit S [Faecalibacterium duncaniae]|uniref:restriction endonuclease subunit S n=1 Tax=Faecalibacterium duncaniae (strain DSM 17677 / JCM 31915 / A2-165) TaxID=411483 RepID=UPI00293F84FA|nr:restriction endonuclease subunit S [Faecalibacterium duncaniae]MDV5050043.1 restriction endonuclease subunit S [Faecalibacterium duncaniae]